MEWKTFQIKYCNHKSNIVKPHHFCLKLIPLKCHFAFTSASYLVPVPLYFPSVVLGLETSLQQNVCVCLDFIKGFHCCCFWVQSCCYIFFLVPLERADRWKMTTPWVNQSNALHLPSNIVFSGAHTNLIFYFVLGLTHSSPPLTRNVNKNSWIYQSSRNDGLGWRLVLLYCASSYTTSLHNHFRD